MRAPDRDNGSAAGGRPAPVSSPLSRAPRGGPAPRNLFSPPNPSSIQPHFAPSFCFGVFLPTGKQRSSCSFPILKRQGLLGSPEGDGPAFWGAERPATPFGEQSGQTKAPVRLREGRVNYRRTALRGGDAPSLGSPRAPGRARSAPPPPDPFVSPPLA